MRFCSLMLAIAGFSLFFVFKQTLRENYSPCWNAMVPKRLITHGVYCYIRHPIYTRNLVIMFGAFLVMTSLYMLLIIFVMWLYYLRSIRLEETSLVAAFGREYEAYQAVSGRFLPRMLTDFLPSFLN